MNLRPAAIALTVLGICFAASSEALAQRAPYSRPSANAASNILSRPTVSPYLNLLRGGVGGYQSLVRPLADNNRAARQNARQIQQLRRNTGQARTGRSAGSTQFAPTGHSTAYRNFSHFYPNLR